eukprot:Lithocolla_globosa_v1_NODE_778_length_3290_cov_24.418547.p7 type:complete len:111 gc:universal NODE_778_length_3290_cov_24.418547:1080-748(-)
MGSPTCHCLRRKPTTSVLSRQPSRSMSPKTGTSDDASQTSGLPLDQPFHRHQKRAGATTSTFRGNSKQLTSTERTRSQQTTPETYRKGTGTGGNLSNKPPETSSKGTGKT